MFFPSIYNYICTAHNSRKVRKNFQGKLQNNFLKLFYELKLLKKTHIYTEENIISKVTHFQ